MRCTEEDQRPAAPRRTLPGLVFGLAALVAGCAAPVSAPTPAPAPVAAPEPAPTPAPMEPTQSPPAVPGNFPPEPAPAPPPQATPPVPRPSVDLGPRVVLPSAPSTRNWDEFRKMAATRMVKASPKWSYMTKPQPLLFGIPILEIELNGNGSVRDMSVTRPPANIDAQDTIDYAMEAVQRGAPYGDVTQLPKPWKFTEVFLFNNKRQFKPRSLD